MDRLGHEAGGQEGEGSECELAVGERGGGSGSLGASLNPHP